MVARIEGLECWKCGASLEALPQPLGRREECPACRTDLHVCRLCEFHDTSVAKHCREPVADEVTDKERANFCGYFTPRPGVHRGGPDPAAAQARGDLEALFGLGDGASGGSPTEADQARSELDSLFGLGDKKE